MIWAIERELEIGRVFVDVVGEYLELEQSSGVYDSIGDRLDSGRMVDVSKLVANSGNLIRIEEQIVKI